MAEIIRTPDFTGDGKTGGIIFEWKKKLGDQVNEGEEFVTLETEEMMAEVEAPCRGLLLYVGVEKGKSWQPGNVLAVIGEEDDDALAMIIKDNEERSNRNKR